jgi:hypothetical protein
MPSQVPSLCESPDSDDLLFPASLLFAGRRFTQVLDMDAMAALLASQMGYRRSFPSMPPTRMVELPAPDYPLDPEYVDRPEKVDEQAARFINSLG